MTTQRDLDEWIPSRGLIIHVVINWGEVPPEITWTGVDRFNLEWKAFESPLSGGDGVRGEPPECTDGPQELITGKSESPFSFLRVSSFTWHLLLLLSPNE